MIHAIYALSLGLLTFALAGEAHTVLLRVLGTIVAVWFTLLGAFSGWAAARK